MATTTRKNAPRKVVLTHEQKIAALEKEVGFAAFPYSRASYIKEKLGVDEKDADREKLGDVLGSWLAFLSAIKYQKDNNSQMWSKMCNWD